MKIKGNTVGTPSPRANLLQTDPKKADYVVGRDIIVQTVNGVAPDENGDVSVEIPEGSQVEIVDDLETADSTKALSANMGKILRVKIEDDVLTLEKATQAALAQRVQTVNGVGPDGDGNVTVEADVTDEQISAAVDAYMAENPADVSGVVKTVNGTAPDENGEVALDIPTETAINALIDAKLGVIENGTY